jgi:imidazolonepropionase-like amidohydrolase
MFRRPPGGARAFRTPVLALFAVAALSVAVPAQEPPQPEPERSSPEAGRGGRGRRQAPLTAIRAGFVHPVSSPTIEDGVVLVRGNRIVAVGKAGEVEIPDGVEVLAYPDGHVYPGFVDALSRAFADDIVGDANVDAGASVGEVLDRFDEKSRALAAQGVTTAYVSNRSDAAWRGQGTLIRTAPDGYAAFPERSGTGLHLRLTAGNGPVHPLQLAKQLEAAGREFAQLEAYEKSRDEHRTKLEEYEKRFAEYLAWHRKKNGKPEAGTESEGEAKPAGTEAPAEAKPAAEGQPSGEAGEGRRGRRRPPGGEGGSPPAPQDPPRAGEAGPDAAKQDAAKQDAAKQNTAKPDAAKPDGDKPPERPKYPAEPKPDPAKDALIAVRDGELALFVEAHRAAEVDRALALMREHELRRVVLELATGAVEAAPRIAAAGVPVIVDSALAPADALRGDPRAALVPEDLEHRSLARALCEAGAPLALGSGDNDRGRNLPSLYAEAIGVGIDPATALRAITLTPAEILGVADRVGSLEPRKLADLVITSGPLDASDARILRVMSAGTTVHETRR